MKMEKIYHEQNGRILKDSNEHHIFEKFYAKGYAIEVSSWTEDVNEFGYFRCTAYVVSSCGKYIVKEWKPSPGYAWSETVIYRVTE